MAYSSGGLIEATDFNTFGWGGSSGTYRTSPNNLAVVLGVGTGDYGYGQSVTGLESVAAGGTVTATQWSTLVTGVNKALQHQGGAALSPTPAITAGNAITHEADLSSSIGTIVTNRLNAGSMGSTTTGSVFTYNWVVANQTAAASNTQSRTVTFASANQARYFFNAGGKINIDWYTANGSDTNREISIRDMIDTEFNNLNNFAYTSNSGRGGTGGTLNTNATTIGYYDLTTSAQNLVKITSDNAGYTADTIELRVKTDAVNSQGSGDKGRILTFEFYVYTGPRSLAFNQAINMNLNMRIDIQNPETTYLSNSWGGITIA